MSGSVGKLVTMAMVMGASMKYNRDQEKERILDEWEKSKQLPRKKKKQRRKELILDWSIAHW